MLPTEHPLVSSAKREAVLVLTLWCVACAYVIGYCGWNAYRQPLDGMQFVLGFPAWVFWGIVVPWLVCSFLSFVISTWCMTDGDLGEEPEADLKTDEESQG